MILHELFGLSILVSVFTMIEARTGKCYDFEF